MCECELRMKILLIFTLCLISDGGDSKAVTGYSGGGVLIKCKYHTGNIQDPKYFCKNSTSGCSDQIWTELENQWIDSGRFSLYDDTESTEFWVMITELTVQDAGTYQCGVDTDFGMDIYTQVKLNVTKNVSYNKSISMTVHVGEDLNVSCKYPQSLRNKTKFLCKMSLQVSACSYKISVNASEKYIHVRKFSLYVDRERRILSVSIRNVTARDSGEYWCGAEAAWQSDQGYKVYFTQIILTVTETGFPSSIAITVSVILLLLLIAFIFITVILQRRCRLKAGMAPAAEGCVQFSGNNQENEENKDSRRLIFTISPAQPPTTITDASQNVYDNTLLPTSPCDSAFYSTAEFPTILPDQDISISTQLPTDLPASSVSAAQQSGGESVTGPVYAAVSSHTKATSSNSTVPKIIIDKEEISCDKTKYSHDI